MAALLAVAVPAAAQGGPDQTPWRAFYVGTSEGDSVQLDLSVEAGRARVRVLLPTQGRTLLGEAPSGQDGALSVPLSAADGSNVGRLRGRRSLAPNDDGDTFEGRLELDGDERTVALRRWAQQVTRHVWDGVIDASVSYPRVLAPPGDAFDPLLEPPERAVLEDFLAQGRAARADGDLYHGWQMLSTTTIEGAAGPYLSVLAERYRYTGGAHGNQYFEARVLERRPGGVRVLRFPDLFPLGEQTVARLTPPILEALLQQQAAWVVEGQVGGLTVDDLSVVSLTPAGLSFVFPPYAMGPYVQGAFTVVVPYAEVLDLVPPDGAVAAFAAASGSGPLARGARAP